MSPAPPPLAPKSSTPGWLLAILWILPSICILLMIPFAIYWAHVTKGEQMLLIFLVFGVIYVALLSVFGEINGRIKASTIHGNHLDASRTRRRHSALFFFSQLILGPVMVLSTTWVIGLLR